MSTPHPNVVEERETALRHVHAHHEDSLRAQDPAAGRRAEPPTTTWRAARTYDTVAATLFLALALGLFALLAMAATPS